MVLMGLGMEQHQVVKVCIYTFFTMIHTITVVDYGPVSYVQYIVYPVADPTTVPTDQLVAISSTSNEFPTTAKGNSLFYSFIWKLIFKLCITSLVTTQPGFGKTSDSPNIAGPAAGAVVGVLAVVLLIVLAVFIVIVLKR